MNVWGWTRLTRTVDNILTYPYEDASRIQISSEAAQMQGSIAFVIFDVNFSFVTQKKTGHLIVIEIKKQINKNKQ